MEDESAVEKVRSYRPRHAHLKKQQQHLQHEAEEEEDRALADEALAHMDLSEELDECVCPVL